MEKRIVYKNWAFTYDIYGNSNSLKALLLIGGYLNSGPKFWIRQIRNQDFCQKYKIIIPDGFSGSAVGKSTGNNNIEDVVEAYHSIVINEGCAAVSLVGFSFGCCILDVYCYLHGEYVDNIALISPAFRASFRYWGCLNFAEEMLGKDIELESVLKFLLLQTISEEECEISRGSIGNILSMFLKHNTRETLTNVINMMKSPLIEESYRISNRGIAFFGEKDDVSPAQLQGRIKEHFSCLEEYVFENAGHTLLIFYSGKINEMIQAIFIT